MVTKFCLSLIDFYRNYISTLMLPRCRFYPTCSVYARQAIVQKGLVGGLALALWRLARCHPFHRGHFYDPVEDVDEPKGAC